jgi:hypothetical protein
MTMVNTLDISPAFTIEDIHKIRERNYEVTKGMTIEEKLRYYNTPRTDAEQQIERLRASKDVPVTLKNL